MLWPKCPGTKSLGAKVSLGLSIAGPKCLGTKVSWKKVPGPKYPGVKVLRGLSIVGPKYPGSRCPGAKVAGPDRRKPCTLIVG